MPPRRRRSSASGGLQPRFAHDFAAAREVVAARDRRGAAAASFSLPGVPGWPPAAYRREAIFLQTLIHGFDALLWLNRCCPTPTEVHATADALVAPDFKGAPPDTAVVVIRFETVRSPPLRPVSPPPTLRRAGGLFAIRETGHCWHHVADLDVHHDASGRHCKPCAVTSSCSSMPTHAEFVEFVDAVREQRVPAVTGHDARRALTVALASIESIRAQGPVHMVCR